MINEWPNNNHKQSKHETHTNIYQVQYIYVLV